jgi:ferrous iron transport protein A
MERSTDTIMGRPDSAIGVPEVEITGKRVVRLRDLEPGESGRISRLACRGKLRRRLMDLGVVAGTPFTLERVAPLGDPIELKLTGFNLSLRREEAGNIWVELPEDADDR